MQCCSNLQVLANSLTNIPDISSDIFDVRRTRKQQARGVSALTQSPKTSVSLINLGQKVLTGQYVFFNSKCLKIAPADINTSRPKG